MLDFTKVFVQMRRSPIVIFEIINAIQAIFITKLTIPVISIPLPSLQLIGITIFLVGVALASWAKIVMGSSWGRPAQHDKTTQPKLVTAGPFQFTRNPIYVGLFLMFFGQQFALASYGIILSIVFAIVIKKTVQIEEALLSKHFGTQYKTFVLHVPRFL